MSEILDQVKHSVDELRLWAKKSAARPDAAQRMIGFADICQNAADELVRLYGLTSALPPDLGNIHDLPQALLDELSVSKADELEDQIITAINSYRGEASLNQILVGLFRKFKVTQKRRFLMNKLYRMPSVWSVEGRKGVYTTKVPTVQEEDDEYDDPFPTINASDMDDEIPL